MEGPSATEPLRWRCRCGAVEGVLRRRSDDRSFHAICHCVDCQAFQHALGRAESVLDAHGGTEIVGVTPAAFELLRGRDRVAALRLTSRGLLRWYTRCCDTPIANTAPSCRVAHVGMIAAPITDANGPRALEALFGPVTDRIFCDRAVDGPVPGATRALRMAPGMVASIGARLLRGEHRRSAFFDARGEPLSAPRVLAADERDALAPYRR